MFRPTRHSALLLLAFCLILAAEGLFALGFRTILAARRNKHSDLRGTWVMQLPEQVRTGGDDAAMLPHGTLKLNDDSTFTQHMENYVMYTLVMDSKGKYTRSGDTVTLSGTSITYCDDGYAKGTDKEPFTWRLRYADNALTMLDNRTDGAMFPKDGWLFRRQTPGASSKPKSPLEASRSRGVQIVQEAEHRYAGLNTYSDEGMLTSAGDGPMAKHARFQTRFVRPLTFLFQFALVIDGKECKLVVWSQGRTTLLYTGNGGGSDERGVGEALSSITPTTGGAATLVPMLLLPDEIRAPKLDTFFEEISLAGEQKVSGKDCYVICLSNPEGTHLKLWIEKSNYLILRASDRTSEATITYQPKCNIKIADSEFRFTPPK